MSFGSSANRRTGDQPPGPKDSPAYVVPHSSGGHGFLIVSALIHIAAVVVLMHAWSGGLPHAKAETTAATSAPQQPPTPRLSIDIAPVQYCEMDIEKIVSRPLVAQPHVSQPHAESFR